MSPSLPLTEDLDRYTVGFVLPSKYGIVCYLYENHEVFWEGKIQGYIFYGKNLTQKYAGAIAI